MAILIGGFAFNASAQDKKTPAQEKKDVKTENWDKVLKDYEQAVDKCVTIFQKMQKNDGTGKDLSKEFNTTLAKANNLKTKLENARDQLDRTQVDRLNKANQKLQQVHLKN